MAMASMEVLLRSFLASFVPEAAPARMLSRMLVKVRPPRRPTTCLGRGRRRVSLGPGPQPAEDVPLSEPARRPTLASLLHGLVVEAAHVCLESGVDGGNVGHDRGLRLRAEPEEHGLGSERGRWGVPGGSCLCSRSLPASGSTRGDRNPCRSRPKPQASAVRLQEVHADFMFLGGRGTRVCILAREVENQFRTLCADTVDQNVPCAGRVWRAPRSCRESSSDFQEVRKCPLKVPKHVSLMRKLRGTFRTSWNSLELTQQLLEARRTLPAHLGNVPGHFVGTPCRKVRPNSSLGGAKVATSVGAPSRFRGRRHIRSRG